MRAPQNVSESVRRLNPSIYGCVGGLPDPKRQPDQRRESQDQQLDKSKEGVGYRITIISVRRKLCDAHDNLRYGSKSLVDQITNSLGFASDDNPRLSWDYQQFKSSGPSGTIVLISTTL